MQDVRVVLMDDDAVDRWWSKCAVTARQSRRCLAHLHTDALNRHYHYYDNHNKLCLPFISLLNLRTHTPLNISVLHQKFTSQTSGHFEINFCVERLYWLMDNIKWQKTEGYFWLMRLCSLITSPYFCPHPLWKTPRTAEERQVSNLTHLTTCPLVFTNYNKGN